MEKEEMPEREEMWEEKDEGSAPDPEGVFSANGECGAGWGS